MPCWIIPNNFAMYTSPPCRIIITMKADYTNQTTPYANFRCLPFVSFATVTGPPPVMSLNCQRVWDASGHFNISLNWSFPDASQISHITQFVVTPVLQNSGPIRNSYHLTRTEVRELINTHM